jgi:hypothetical protein
MNPKTAPKAESKTAPKTDRTLNLEAKIETPALIALPKSILCVKLH